MGSINSRAKGAAAEREFIRKLGDYLGDEAAAKLKRNLEQTRQGGHDIEGLEEWALEIKRYRQVKDGDILKFWGQAERQAQAVGRIPALAYREDMQSWRIRVPMSVLRPDFAWTGVEWTAELGMEAFATLVRERLCSSLHISESPDTLPPISDGS